jgi:LacI family transcriptional regulator
MVKRPTISDVARLCGVTPATVSRVLNRKQKFSASPAVRDRIQETAKQLGYAPDLAARNLNSGRTNIIGVLASPLTHISLGVNQSLLIGIAESLHAGGYDVFLEFSSPDPERGLPFWRFDGAILLPDPKTKAVQDLDRRRVPYVCVNEKIGNPVACVLADERMGAEKALDHLAELGHKKFAYADARKDYTRHYSLIERYDALQSEARARSMEMVGGRQESFKDGLEFVERAVKVGGATAVITYEHRIAIMISGAAQGMGLRIPDDFSLICFNDVFPVEVVSPTLTAIAIPGREMGRTGADLLLKTLISELPAERMPQTREIRVPENLIIRASTGPPSR